MSKNAPRPIDKDISDCLEELKEEKAEQTVRTYKIGLRRFRDYLKENKIDPTTTPFNEDDAPLFIGFVAWLVENRYSKSTLNAYMSAQKALLDYLVIAEHINMDHAATLRYNKAWSKANKRRDQRLGRNPVVGQAEKILEAAKLLNYPSPFKERDIALIEFLYITGCRVGEAVALEVKALDFAEQEAVVKGKGKERYVFFTDRFITAIQNYWAIRGWAAQSDPVFAQHGDGAGNNHLPITTNTARSVVKDAATLAGIDPHKFTPHYFRHTFITRAYNKTIDMEKVRLLAGHASGQTTQGYIHVDKAQLKEAHRQTFNVGKADKVIVINEDYHEGERENE